MNCPNCNKEIVPDKVFCNWCESFIPNPQAGKRAGLFRRWFATAIDPIIALILCYPVAVILGWAIVVLISENAVVVALFLVAIGYGVFFLWLLSKGMTPGKWLLGEQVVGKVNGDYPGFWRMILREIIGKLFLSGAFLGLGYFSAIWDKDSQAWHDKIAGTVVIHRQK